MKMDYWQKLTNRARQCGRDEPFVTMPYGFERRVVSEWLDRVPWDPLKGWRPILAAAVICASVIMLLSLAFNFGSMQPENLEEATITDSLIKLSLNQ
jgi:hypothetical protein